MKLKKTFLFSIFSLFVLSSVSNNIVFAKDKNIVVQSEKINSNKPIVAVIKASWCPACEKISPTVMSIMKDYNEKAEFIVFDVSNSKSTKEAIQKADSKGLTDFFKKYKSKTSTVAIIDPNTKKILKEFYAEGNKDSYVNALDEIIKI